MTQSMTRVRYRVGAMNFLAALINYGDRVAISVTAPFILAEFHFSPAIWGVVLSAFFWTYSPAALLGGFMVDRIGVRRAYTVCMLVWSLTIPLTASAWNAVSFIVARLLFGFGEGPQVPISTALTANWFPRRQTSAVLNLAQSGTTIGPVIATPLVVWSSASLGWRPTFVILGAFGLLWALAWWFLARDRPADHPAANAAERAFVVADHEAAEGATESGGSTPGFWSLLRNPSVAALSAGFFAYSWVLFMFLTWYPQYLVQARGVDKSELGSIATIPWITATAGLIAGGLFADRMVKRLGNYVTPRKWMIIGSLAAVAVCVPPSAFVASPTLALVLVSIATFFLLASFHYQSLIVALVPRSHTGRLAGVIQMVSTIAGILAPIVTGVVVQATGSFATAFVVAGAITLLGAIAVLALIKESREVGPAAALSAAS
jgi:ACS family hexuronate transporter-like MFS transporter